MEEQRRAELRQIVDNFENTENPPQEVIDSFCQRMGIVPSITAGELEDYRFQVRHDNRMGLLYPLVLAEIQKLQYIPEFAGMNKRKEMREANDQIRVNIVKLFEEHAIEYRLLDTLAKEIAREIGQTVESAGTTAFNKALEVLMHLAHAKFGADFNMKHAADYARDVFEKAAAKNAEDSGEGAAPAGIPNSADAAAEDTSGSKQDTAAGVATAG